MAAIKSALHWRYAGRHRSDRSNRLIHISVHYRSTNNLGGIHCKMANCERYEGYLAGASKQSAHFANGPSEKELSSLSGVSLQPTITGPFHAHMTPIGHC